MAHLAGIVGRKMKTGDGGEYCGERLPLGCIGIVS